MERTYDDSPALWQKVIGPELWFQFGVYEAPPGVSWTLDESGRRHLERQLDIAGLDVVPDWAPHRVLDIGFGWGAALEHLASRYPDCRRLDGINVSRSQTEYAARRLVGTDLVGQVHLFLGNARDLSVLPEPADPYDLVICRGSITHFSYRTFEMTMAALSGRVRDGTKLIISESLYKIPIDDYESAVPDDIDRLACGYRKSLGYLTEVLERHGFTLCDARVLPSNEEVIWWLLEVKSNIDTHFPDRPPQALRELRDTADNWTVALRADTVSVYSIIARYRGPTGGGPR